MKTGWIVGVLFVLAILVVPAAAGVTTQSNSALSVSVTQSDPIKTNDFNYVTIKLDPKTSYPISARIVIKPSYFAIKPEWVKGCDAMKTGSGVTCTIWNFQDEKTIKVVIPGAVLEGLSFKDGKARLIGGVEVYPFTSSAAAVYGVEAKNLQTLSVEPPFSQAIDTNINVFMAMVLIAFGAGLILFGTKNNIELGSTLILFALATVVILNMFNLG